MKTLSTRLWLCGMLIVLGLTACSSSTPSYPVAESTPDTKPSSQAGGSPPVILRVDERQEARNGFLILYRDIYFTDSDGDADYISLEETSSSLSYPYGISGGELDMPAQEQKTGAVIPIHWTCNQKLQITVESRISDRLGNTSEPISLAFSCTTPLPVDTRSFLIDELSLAIPTALILIVGFWLLFRKTPSERLPAIRSTLLLFCLLLVLRFVHLILHEGGHSLYAIARGIPVTLYVHPFAFAGYSRPALDNIWKDILGSLTALPLSLLISLLFWKRRSIATLLPVMLFPYVALGDGTNVTGLEGDFRNLVQTYGISPIPFVCLGVLILLVGILSFLSVFPLIGLGPKDKRALFVIPTAFFLMNALSIPVAYLFVPGSPIDREYFLGQEIMTTGVFTSLLSTIVGVILAVLYLTVFRKIYLRLPAWLRTETVHLTWKDLRLPAVLAGVSVVLGILIIT